jgi:uncharacterized protein DUF5317
MFLLAFLLLSVVAVPLTGGRLTALTEVRVRHLWLVPVAIVTQVGIITVWPGGSHAWHVAVHLLTYALAGLFLWCNRRLPGATLLGLGFLANTLVIVLNGGVMPASASAQRLAGIELEAGRFENSVAVAGARLGFLGDVFAIPHPIPLANVFSIGDVLLGLGAAVFLIRWCRAGSTVAPPGYGRSA